MASVVTISFDYDLLSVEQRLLDLRHEHDDLVASNFHSHVGNRYCMELFILDGSLEDISTFVGEIRATQDTVSVDYSVNPVEDFAETLA